MTCSRKLQDLQVGCSCTACRSHLTVPLHVQNTHSQSSKHLCAVDAAVLLCMWSQPAPWLGSVCTCVLVNPPLLNTK